MNAVQRFSPEYLNIPLPKYYHHKICFQQSVAHKSDASDHESHFPVHNFLHLIRRVDSVPLWKNVEKMTCVTAGTIYSKIMEDRLTTSLKSIYQNSSQLLRNLLHNSNIFGMKISGNPLRTFFLKSVNEMSKYHHLS